eukprot:jgi/Chrzof1/7487/Cz02g25220.t1
MMACSIRVSHLQQEHDGLQHQSLPCNRTVTLMSGVGLQLRTDDPAKMKLRSECGVVLKCGSVVAVVVVVVSFSIRAAPLRQEHDGLQHQSGGGGGGEIPLVCFRPRCVQGLCSQLHDVR